MADTFSFSHEPRARTRSFDRFIPNRSAMDFDFAHFKLTTPSPKKHGFGGDGNHDDSGCWSPETPEDQRMTDDDDVEGLRQDIEVREVTPIFQSYILYIKLLNLQ